MGKVWTKVKEVGNKAKEKAVKAKDKAAKFVDDHIDGICAVGAGLVLGTFTYLTTSIGYDKGHSDGYSDGLETGWNSAVGLANNILEHTKTQDPNEEEAEE